MKKRLYLFFAVALACLATACVEDIQNETTTDEGSKMVTEKIMAVNGDSNTKAAVDADAKFTWSAGDQIAVHVSDGKYYTTNALAAGGSNTATFSVTYPEGKTRDAFAIFPASIVSVDAANYGQSDASLDVTLPASYTLAQVSGTTTPCPMIAENTSDTWTFKQLCGLLRLTVNGIPNDATGMVIQFPGKKVNGNFSITSTVEPGSSTIETGVPAAGEDKITVSFDAGITSATVNIPLPTGTYEYVYVTPVESATKVAAIRNINKIEAASYTATRAHGKKLTTTMVSFSVSATKKVFFAPGNLVKTDKSYTVGSGNETYAFETTSFSTNGGSLGYGGEAPSSTSARGYFTWDEIATANETPREFTVNGVSGWKSLSCEEWEYVYFNTTGREMNDGVKRSYRVDLGESGVKIGFLLPPNQATSSDVSDLIEGGLTKNVSVNIETYISKGFVFLPAAGWFPTSWYEYWASAGEIGYYWTTYTDGDYYYIHFFAGGQGEEYDAADYYCSVRLVHEYE